MPTESRLQELERCFQFRPAEDAARIITIVERQRVYYFILIAIHACETAEKKNPKEYERLFQLAVEMWNLAEEFDRLPMFQD